MIAPRLPQLSQASTGPGAIGRAFVTAAPAGRGAQSVSSQDLLFGGAAPRITGPYLGQHPEQPVGRAER